MNRLIYVLFYLFPLFFAHVFGGSTRSPPLLISAQPSKLISTIDEGNSLTLSCLFSGSPVPNIVWFLGETFLQQNSNSRMAQFTINAATRDDEGMYKCLGSNVEGSNDNVFFVMVKLLEQSTQLVTTTSPPIVFPVRTYTTSQGFTTRSPPEKALPIKVKLTVRYPTRFRGQELSQLFIDEGDTLILHCEVESGVPFNSYWKKNTAYIVESKNRKTFRVNNFRLSDSATYTCEAICFPTCGSVGRSVKVRIGQTIQWRRVPPVKTFFQPGNNIVVDVSVVPIYNGVTIQWYTIQTSFLGNEQYIPVNTSEINIMTSNYNQRLTFRPFKEENANEYIVAASNQFMRLSSRFNLYIRTNIITNPPRSRTGFEPGRQLFLPCVVKGYPIPQVNWYRSAGNGGTEVLLTEYTIRNRNYTVSRNGLLIVDTLLSDDGTKFICKAAGNDGRGSRMISYTLQAGQLPKFIGGYCNTGYCPGDERITLVCRGMSISRSLQYKWFKDSNFSYVISTTSKYQVFSNGNLVILNPTASDAGSYQCQISDMYGTLTKSCNVTASTPPQFIPQNQKNDLLVTLGGNFRMRCSVSGTRPLSIVWLKDGSALDPTAADQFISLSNLISVYTLSVNNILGSSAGVYTCSISNCADRVERSLNVSVRTSIQITSEPSIFNFCENTTVKLPCTAVGFPEPKLKWYHDSNEITDDNVSYQISSSNTLIIHDAKTFSTGIYNCTAYNKFGYNSFSIQINIHTVRPPVLIIRNSSLPVLRSDYRLYCVPFFKPSWLTYTYKWYKNTQRLYQSSKFKLDVEGQLLIKSFRSNDLANYICVVNNCGGTSSYTYSLSKYEGQGTPPSIRDTRNLFLKPVGSSATFFCQVSGDPEPAITWLGSNSVITNDGTFSIGQSSLTISSLSINLSGNYTCVATNQFGTARRRFEVFVTQVPLLKPTSGVAPCIGNEACFDCVVLSANPAPTITWSYDNQILRDGSNRITIYPNNTLCLSNAVSNDNGFYKCTADNNVGENSVSGYLNVVECCGPVVFTKKVTTEFNVAEGTTITLECPIEPYTYQCPYSLSWRELNAKSGGKLTKIASSDSRRIGNNLRVTVTEEAQGSYRCDVMNTNGLRAQVYSVLIVSAPQIVNHENSLTYKQGSTVNFTCPIMGYPVPSYNWMNSREVISSTRYLYMPSVSDSNIDTYICTATNVHGTASISVNLNICTAPKLSSISPSEPIEEGSKAVFYCRINGKIKPTAINWYLGNSTTSVNTLNSEDYRIVVSSSGKSGRFVIVKAKPSHEGLVRCEIVTSCATLTHSEYLVVQEKGSICKLTIRESNIKFESSSVPRCLDQVSMFCPGKGSPTPSITWQFNGAAISNPILSKGGKQLIIPKPDITKAGIYTCRVENECKYAELNFNLTISYPQNSVSQKTLTNTRGDTIALPCHPSTSIPCWSKNLKLLDVDNSRYTVARNGELTITNVISEDSGIYLCLADVGSQTYSYIYQLYITNS